MDGMLKTQQKKSGNFLTNFSLTTDDWKFENPLKSFHFFKFFISLCGKKIPIEITLM
jgi:hypothetical protein